MDTATARVDDETLDAIQVAQGKVHLRDFRLLPDCPECVYWAEQPATKVTNTLLKDHILFTHDDLLIL